ncbi:MAG: Hsp20/alpha crystallin family protein [Patescibacteria group bacterium]|nr:Hsp20/alpha crystallin family protein [Patescibacteria group bacterium]
MDNEKQPFILSVFSKDEEQMPLDFSMSENEKWQEGDVEGKLSVDVLQKDNELLVIATMAGSLPDKIELHLHNDLLTIRGVRYSPALIDAEYYYKECFWGKFSRSIVLPVDVRGELAQAEYKNGVLTVRLPIANNQNQISVTVVEE